MYLKETTDVVVAHEVSPFATRHLHFQNMQWIYSLGYLVVIIKAATCLMKFANEHSPFSIPQLHTLLAFHLRHYQTANFLAPYIANVMNLECSSMFLQPANILEKAASALSAWWLRDLLTNLGWIKHFSCQYRLQSAWPFFSFNNNSKKKCKIWVKFM